MGKTKADPNNTAYSCPCGVKVKLLVDECLHTSLLEIAHAANHAADHVNYLSLGSSKDWQLMATARAQDYTFVTNNRSDFLCLHGKEPLHAGVIYYYSQCHSSSSARALQRGTQTCGHKRSDQYCS